MLTSTPEERSSFAVFHLIETIEKSAAFARCCYILVFFNTLVLAMVVDYKIKNLGKPLPPVYPILETCFTIYYMFELLVKISSQRRRFFAGGDRTWNTLDCVLVASAVQEQVLAYLGLAGLQNISYLRSLRLMKIIKLLRIVRLMRQFRELRLILESIMGSFKVVLWSACLCFSISAMFSMCFLQGMTDLLLDGPARGVDPFVLQRGRHYWSGGIFNGVLSLFMAITGGDDWSNIAEPLWYAGFHFYVLFVVYLVFFLFVMMNVITSLFLDSICQYAAKDEENVIQEQKNQKQFFMQKVAEIWLAIDHNKNGTITYADFLAHQDDERLELFAESVGINCRDLSRFFSILSSDGTRLVDIETFVNGCIELHGTARAIDLMETVMTVRSLHHELHALHEEWRQATTQEFGEIRKMIKMQEASRRA